jgi:hypothetical protein
VTKFVCDSRQISGFFPVSSASKSDCYDISEILLKVALNTISHKTKLNRYFLMQNISRSFSVTCIYKPLILFITGYDDQLFQNLFFAVFTHFSIHISDSVDIGIQRKYTTRDVFSLLSRLASGKSCAVLIFNQEPPKQ